VGVLSSDVIQNSQVSDQIQIREAEHQVQQWEETNLPLYAHSLAILIAEPSHDVHDRTLACLLLKSTLFGKV
jgi:hypothetical protein